MSKAKLIIVYDNSDNVCRLLREAGFDMDKPIDEYATKNGQARCFAQGEVEQDVLDRWNLKRKGRRQFCSLGATGGSTTSS